jgi:hypothetical protein
MYIVSGGTLDVMTQALTMDVFLQENKTTSKCHFLSQELGHSRPILNYVIAILKKV